MYTLMLFCRQFLHFVFFTDSKEGAHSILYSIAPLSPNFPLTSQPDHHATNGLYSIHRSPIQTNVKIVFLQPAPFNRGLRQFYMEPARFQNQPLPIPLTIFERKQQTRNVKLLNVHKYSLVCGFPGVLQPSTSLHPTTTSKSDQNSDPVDLLTLPRFSDGIHRSLSLSFSQRTLNVDLGYGQRSITRMLRLRAEQGDLLRSAKVPFGGNEKTVTHNRALGINL